MQAQKLLPVLLPLLVGAANTDVVMIHEKPAIDGKLDEACWRAAEWNSDFKPIHDAPYKTARNGMSFAIVADADAIYVGFRCEEKVNFAKLRDQEPRPIFQCDDVEVFLSPSGDPLCFYQFAIAARHGVNAAIYHIEGGLTHPDPYAPEWEHATALGENGWTAEIAIPLTAFYNTRQADWKRTWIVNVSRDNVVTGAEKVSWSPLVRSFLEPTHFRSMAGFPIRKAADDVAMHSAVAEIVREKGGKLEGKMTVSAYAAKAGAYRFTSPYASAKEVTLAAGENAFEVACTFPKNARYQVPMTLTRVADGKTFFREYPVPVDYDALRVTFTAPAYRTNFYPGQDASKVAGRVVSALTEPITLVLEGAGIPRTEKTVKGGETFVFETPGFAPGEATLTATCGKETRQVTLRRLIPNGHTMSWIENGNLMVDGKPVIRRMPYAWGYACSKPYLKRLAAENLYMTTNTLMRGLESGRLIRGSEAREGVKDDPPSPAMFAAIDKAMASMKGLDFCGYYLCDEPECRSISPIYLRHIYNYVKEKDPYHVCEICSRDAARYIDSCDLVEAHPYLSPAYQPDGSRIHNVPMNRYGDFFACIADQNRPDKMIGAVPFAFSYHYSSPACDYATFEEYVASIWASACDGAKSFYPFLARDFDCHAGLLEGIRFTNSSLGALQDFILGRRKRLVKTADYVATEWTRPDGARLIAVVNFTTQARRVTLKGVKGHFCEFRGTRWFKNAWGKDETVVYLGPYDTVVMTDRPVATDLPSIAAVRATIAKREYARTHRDNQIFGRDTELPYRSSNPGEMSMALNLVDGNLDQQAFVGRGANPWFELAFPGEPIRFRTIRLYGENIDKTEVSVFADGAWRELKATKEIGGDYLLTLDFADVVTADKVKFDFHRDAVNVFELEFPEPRAAAGESVRDWMPGKVGVFAHYLPGETTLKFADDFDVPGLVAQLKAMKADYFILTLGQNSGYYCAPNAAFEKTAGYASGTHCAKRDIPAEIIAALKGTGIRFGLYLPCQPGNRDVNAAVKFGLNAKGVDGGDDRFITAACAERWAAVIREWATRYGEGVSLWWFDGAYAKCGFNDAIAAQYKTVCRAGNPSVQVTFNGGVRKLSPEKQSDYWAGEENEPLSVVPHDGRWYKPGMQWHVLTPMGFTWMWPDCRFRDATLRDWIHQCTSRGGMCTLEMKIDIRSGRLDRGQSEQFARVRE